MPTRPSVLFIGDTLHADFRDAAGMLRAEAELAKFNPAPELIVAAHSRPGAIGADELGRLRRTWPMASVVVLAGSWCEGEPRTGRPWPGVHRVYWYDFPAWWRRQQTLRTSGYCPDWCRPDEQRTAAVVLRTNTSTSRFGIILLNADAATCDALADTLKREGYSSVCATAGGTHSIRAADAAIWVGGQLSDDEESKLSRFCAALAVDRTPVVALLDFPRRDRIERAKEIGVVAVLGKPWLNSHLLSTIQSVSAPASLPSAA